MTLITNDEEKRATNDTSTIMKNMVPVNQLSNNETQDYGLNFISVTTIKYPDKKQIRGEMFVQLVIPCYSPSLQEVKEKLEAGSCIHRQEQEEINACMLLFSCSLLSG